MKLGRPANTVKTVHWTLSLPEPLAAELELLMLDPMLGKPKVGARSELVVSLIRQWIDTKKLKPHASFDSQGAPYLRNPLLFKARDQASFYSKSNQCTCHINYNPLLDNFSISDWFDNSTVETYHNGIRRN
jgi:hypothetical protein